MKTNRTGITRLTTGQCSRVAGGDPGMVLAGGGNSSGGLGHGAASGLAGMGIGIEGGPPAIVTVSPPSDIPLSGFDKALLGAVGSAAGGFAVAGLEYLALGAATSVIAVPAVIAVTGIAVAIAVGYGANELLQHVANDGAYTDGRGVRHAAR